MNNRVLLSEDINPEGKKLFEGKAEVIIAPDTSKATALRLVKEVNGIILRATTIVDDEVMANAPNLKVIARTGVGVDNVDIEAATKRGILVCNFPGMNNLTVAEHTVAMIMALSKQIVHMHESVTSGNWSERFSPFQTEVEGKTLGIIGMGQIGQMVAHKCMTGLGMNILAYDPYFTGEKEGSGIVFTNSIEDIFKQADFVTVHVPNNPNTKGMINASLLKMMKESAYFVNTSRGSIIDEFALIEMLKNKKIRGAALDVFTKEPLPADNMLHSLKNVILSPHCAGSTWESNVRIAKGAAQAVLAVLSGKLPDQIYIYNKQVLSQLGL